MKDGKIGGARLAIGFAICVLFGIALLGIDALAFLLMVRADSSAPGLVGALFITLIPLLLLRLCGKSVGDFAGRVALLGLSNNNPENQPKRKDHDR